MLDLQFWAASRGYHQDQHVFEGALTQKRRMVDAGGWVGKRLGVSCWCKDMRNSFTLKLIFVDLGCIRWPEQVLHLTHGRQTTRRGPVVHFFVSCKRCAAGIFLRDGKTTAEGARQAKGGRGEAHCGGPGSGTPRVFYVALS